MTDPPKKQWNLYYVFLFDRQANPLPPDLLRLLYKHLFEAEDDHTCNEPM